MESPEVEEWLARRERWAVKTGGDPWASGVDLKPVATTVAQLTRLPRADGGSRRAAPVETTLYRVTVEIVEFKYERDDADLHVVVRDPVRDPSRTMIVELPDPTFVPKVSPWRSQIAEARRRFYARYKPTTRFKGGSRQVATITGVGFFDPPHGQRGLAENGIELHPVLSVEFLGR